MHDPSRHPPVRTLPDVERATTALEAGVPAGIEAFDTLIAVVVEKTPLGAALLLRYCDGDAFVSAVQPGVPDTAAPPAFTR